MPIYMDRHNVSKEVTAEIVADLHQKDLKIQHKFNCKGLTYWFDANRKTAFCLVEAPNKTAIKKMHDHAHGEVPHKIIEVEQAVVESFLGRIEDPEKSLKTKLNIINDPAFRTIMVAAVNPISFGKAVGDKSKSIMSRLNVMMMEVVHLYNGRLVKHSPEYFLVSFDSVSNAVLCALKIQGEFEKVHEREEPPLLKLNIGLSAGVPVDEKEGFFEDTIKTAYNYSALVRGVVVLSAEVKELYESENFNTSVGASSVIALSHSDDKFLKELVAFTEKEFNNPLLQAEDFSRFLGYSKSKLYRKLMALTGKSPNTFLKDYRLNKALGLLNKKVMNISEVAMETGYNSSGYFSKCFQGTFGLLPSEYVKSGNI